jgi:hypothetical protein
LGAAVAGGFVGFTAGFFDACDVPGDGLGESDGEEAAGVGCAWGFDEHEASARIATYASAATREAVIERCTEEVVSNPYTGGQG